MPNGLAASTTPDNVVNIMNAVWDIALNRSGITYAGHKQWMGPTGTEISTAGFPYLVVAWPEFAGYAREMLPVGKEMPRDMDDLIEKAWDFQINVYYNWTPTDARTITTAFDTLTKLDTAFTLNYGLNDTNGFPTCEQGRILDQMVRHVTMKDGEYSAAMLKVRAFEALPIVYR